jgi:mono/diheme cytochrome c family protein
VLLAITSEGKLGLGVLAGAFIVFALLSAFVLPRRDPNFPGKRLGLYIVAASLFFVGTMAGVIFFAREEEEAHSAAAAETHGTETGEEPTTTEGAPSAPSGDPAAGEAVFASAGCGGCHTLEAAGTSGKVGPNLDDAKPDEALVVERVTNGMGVMPSFADQLSEKQIHDVAAYVASSTQG